MHIVVYSKENCPACVQVKQFLENKKASYIEKKLNEDFTVEQLLETYSDARAFPVVVIDGFKIENSKLASLFEETNQKFLTE
jgi:glutaredoxin